MKKFTLPIFYFISFLEGGMMLTTELASARKMAVFFGSSMYTWLMVLCITLAGLAIGYYWASYFLSKKHAFQVSRQILSFLFFLLSIALLLWKFNTHLSLFLIDHHFGLLTSVTIDALVLLFPSMFMYGAITTFIIHLSQEFSTLPVYGKILAFSTIGSVVFAVISVLYAFPFIGIQSTINVLSIIALLLSIGIFTIDYLKIIIYLFIFILPEKKLNKNILYQKDGAFSNIMVVQEGDIQYLLVNYIIQSYEDIKPCRTASYIHCIDSILKIHNISNKDVLILGLGGGVLANKLVTYNKNIVGVEIDRRIIDCAKKFFSLNKKIKVVCEDAQWFLHQTKDKYDIIILDLFNGEEPPSYILTKENFLKMKDILKNDSGLIIINWYGYYSGTIGKGTRILINTLNVANFYTSCFLTNKKEENSNILIFARLSPCGLPVSNIKMDNEYDVNTEDKNILSLLNADANFEWRKNYLHFIRHWWY